MPLVNVMVNSRAYTIACDEGEEDHLRDLAGHVDSKVRQLLEEVGQVGDQRLILMAAAVIEQISKVIRSMSIVRIGVHGLLQKQHLFQPAGKDVIRIHCGGVSVSGLALPFAAKTMQYIRLRIQ